MSTERTKLLQVHEEKTYLLNLRNHQRRICLIIGVLLCILFLLWSYFSLASPSFWSTKVPPYSIAQHPIHPELIHPQLHAPFPTNQWWTNLLIRDSVGQHVGEAPVTVMPYTIQSKPKGLEISYGNTRRQVTNSSIIEGYNADVQLSCQEEIGSRYVTKYDPLSVQLEYYVTRHQQNQTLLTIYMVRGSPYITIAYNNVTPTLQVNGTIGSINEQRYNTSQQYHGSRFKLNIEVPGGEQVWTVYTEQPMTWKGLNETMLVGEKKFTGILRVAIVPHSSFQPILDQYASVYPVAATVSHEVDPTGNIGQVHFQFETKGAGNLTELLMLAHPHHQATLVSSIPILHQSSMVEGFKTVKGSSVLVVGNHWIMEENLSNITFDSPRMPRKEYIPDILRALKNDSTYIPEKVDPYFFGKEVARQARLVLIANQLEEQNLRDQILDKLEKWVEPWLKGENEDAFRYDPIWGGLCSKNGLKGIFWMTDFGNGWYSDHHFHYGYLIYTIAVIGKFRPRLLKIYKESILAIVRDIASPTSTDPFYPLARHFSWFDGHSFASGVFVLDGGKSQESVSEAVNAYYAIYLLGLSYQQSELTDFGRILMAMETRAALTYWQMPNSSTIYEPLYRQNKMTGQVGSTKTVYTTWFGPLVENMHLINMIPFTPIAETFLSKSFIQEEYPLLEQALQRKTPPITEGFKGYAFLAHAIDNATTAWSELHDLISYDDGNSKTSSLYWIATRP